MDLTKIKEVFFVFFKLGFIAFGGPAAHIAMMEDEVVNKRKWMTQQYFLDMVGATNLVPGPNSTQMTMHCGHVRAGWAGLIVGGLAFIFPAVIFTLLLAILYGKYGEVPAIAPLFYGIKPAVVGIILNATYKLGKKAVKGWQLAVLGVISLIASLAGMDEFLVIIGLGIIGAFFMNIIQKRNTLQSFLPFLALKPLVLSNISIFMVFLKIAVVLFGSGYVLIAYIDAELVEKLGWLTKAQLLDAIAMGQFTPGPVLTTATFVGYQLNGISGALYASVGMFLPSFLLVGLLVKIIPLLRKSVALSFFLDSVNVAAVGIMAAVTFKIGLDVGVDWKAWLLMALSIIVAFKFPKVSSVWVIVGGSLIGYGLMMI
jgi:chromate transporter